MRSFQIHVLDENQAMAEHIDGSLALLQDDVTDQRFVLTIGGFHFDKGDCVEDGTKAFYLNAHRPTYFGPDNFLSSRLNFDFCAELQLAESILPGTRQHHQRCSGIYQRITPQALGYIGSVVDSYRGDNSAHRSLLEFKLYTNRSSRSEPES